jgi:hypothetical protein
MEVTKPYESIGFGAMEVTKPYESIGFGAMDVTQPYEFIGFGAMEVTKPYEFIGFLLPWSRFGTAAAEGQYHAKRNKDDQLGTNGGSNEKSKRLCLPLSLKQTPLQSSQSLQHPQNQKNWPPGGEFISRPSLLEDCNII